MKELDELQKALDNRPQISAYRSFKTWADVKDFLYDTCEWFTDFVDKFAVFRQSLEVPSDLKKEVTRRILERMKKGSGNSFATQENWIFKIVYEELTNVLRDKLIVDRKQLEDAFIDRGVSAHWAYYDSEPQLWVSLKAIREVFDETFKQTEENKA